MIPCLLSKYYSFVYNAFIQYRRNIFIEGIYKNYGIWNASYAIFIIFKVKDDDYGVDLNKQNDVFCKFKNKIILKYLTDLLAIQFNQKNIVLIKNYLIPRGYSDQFDML